MSEQQNDETLQNSKSSGKIHFSLKTKIESEVAAKSSVATVITPPSTLMNLNASKFR